MRLKTQVKMDIKHFLAYQNNFLLLKTKTFQDGTKNTIKKALNGAPFL